MRKELRLSILTVSAILLVVTPALARISNNDLVSAPAQLVKIADWSFEVNQSPYYATGDNRHMVVSSGCDVNGDGFDDIIIGRKDYDSLGERNSGRAWLFLGSPTGLSDTPAVIFNPPQVRHAGLFGSSVACAGDIDDDGYEDIMIGMVNYEPDPLNYDEGAVFVYYGSPTGPGDTPDWMAQGNAPWVFLGTVVDSAGDVNGDGYDDIIAGTAENTINAVSHAYVWYGGPDGLGDTGLPSNADWSASGPVPGAAGGNYFGYFVYGIEDVNGDSFDDIMITAFLYDDAITDQGAGFVWYGSKDGLGEPGTPENADWKATGDQSNSWFGISGDGVGDLNGDGFDDLAIAAMNPNNEQFDEGNVYVWYGSASGLAQDGVPANADWSASGSFASWLGFVTRPAGDVDHDGYQDLLVTAPNYTVSAGGVTYPGAGAWFVWKGSSNGLGNHGTPLNTDLAGYGDQAVGRLGASEAGAGNVNNDNLPDIFVAAYLYDDGELDEGVVFGYYGVIKAYLPFVEK
jgi:FG-GAP repeat